MAVWLPESGAGTMPVVCSTRIRSPAPNPLVEATGMVVSPGASPAVTSA